MVNIKLRLLPKIQIQSKRFSYLINHAKVVETKKDYTIKSEGLEAIQVMMTQVIPTVVIVINVYMMQVIMKWDLATCKHINFKIYPKKGSLLQLKNILSKKR